MITLSNLSWFDFHISTLYIDKSFKLLWLVPIASSCKRNKSKWISRPRRMGNSEKRNEKFNAKVAWKNEGAWNGKKWETELKAAENFIFIVCSRLIDLVSWKMRNIWGLSLERWKCMFSTHQLYRPLFASLLVSIQIFLDSYFPVKNLFTSNTDKTFFFFNFCCSL